MALINFAVTVLWGTSICKTCGWFRLCKDIDIGRLNMEVFIYFPSYKNCFNIISIKSVAVKQNDLNHMFKKYFSPFLTALR